MRLVISPAKKMNTDTDTFAPRALPVFVERAETLRDALRELSPTALQALWKCNDAIAAQNVERLRSMELREHLTPAILAYEGIQYRYMAPAVFTHDALEYVQEHLRILSGFYGLLRPFDGVTPYRLEMQAKLAVGGHKDLYGYWGDAVAKAVFAETDCVVNLASKEYSLCLSHFVPAGARFITCVFAQRVGDKLAEKGTLCKMARGDMVRFLAEQQAEAPERMKDYEGLGYRFSAEESTEETYVFIKASAG